MSPFKQIKIIIILLGILIIVSITWWAWDSHFNPFGCNNDSDCINTCCGCMTEKEARENCPIDCRGGSPPRDCRCIHGECKDTSVWVSKQLTQCAEEWGFKSLDKHRL
jgi:hypothetical protein